MTFHFTTCRLCRFVKDETLWACLAGLSVAAKHLPTAEVAYSSIQEADKVHYIQYINTLPSREARNAEMSVLIGNYQVGKQIKIKENLPSDSKMYYRTRKTSSFRLA